jgi:hypothetical protein
VERKVEVEMGQIINVKDFIEFLKARKEGKKEKVRALPLLPGI